MNDTGVIDGGTITVTGNNTFAGDWTDNAPAMPVADFSNTQDPNGGAPSTGNSGGMLGTYIQWVGQTADEVGNAAAAIQDSAQSVRQAYNNANSPQPVPLKTAPGRLSPSQVNGLGLAILAIGAIVLITHGGH